MKEEQYLIEKVGRQNPFRVPEGYFEGLTSQVMARVDAEQTQRESRPKARVVWLRPVLYAAASVCALFVSVTAYQKLAAPSVSAPVEQVADSQMADNAFDEAVDYMMVDNQDIYACLSSDY